MANRGAQPGNTNAANKGIWRDAIRKALAQNKNALAACANQLVAAAMNGDMPALKELGDRLDGKPMQSIEQSGPDGGPIKMDMNISPAEAYRKMVNG